MLESKKGLTALLALLAARARERGLTKTEWAARAGVRNETLSRLRGRDTCDFATLQALAHVVDAHIGVLDGAVPWSSPAETFPRKCDRVYEEALLDLCASGDLNSERWLKVGPAFFMAGLATMVASAAGFDRPGLLALAEKLHSGSTQPGVFDRWLAASPVRPSRFLPMLSKA